MNEILRKDEYGLYVNVPDYKEQRAKMERSKLIFNAARNKA